MRVTLPSRSIAVTAGPWCCCGSALDALILKRPPVDPGVVAVALKMAVRQLLPRIAQALDILAAVPVALLLLGLGAGEAVLVDLAQRHQHMRVNVPVVAVAVGRVNGEVRRVAFPLKLLADKILHQAAVLFERLLVRQRDVEVHRQLRIAALLEALHLVDELAEVVRPIRRILRRIDAGREGRAEVR